MFSIVTNSFYVLAFNYTLIMTGARKLSTEERLEVVVKIRNGMTWREVADSMKISESTILRILRKHRETGSVLDKPRSGRPRKTTARDDRVIVRMSLADRRLTATDICARLYRLHRIRLAVRTVRARLLQAGLKSCVAARKPLLTAEHCRRRRAFAAAHHNWTVDHWKQVLWSDESSFQVFCGGSRVIVRRRVGERFHKNCINPTVKHGGRSLMVWGCMSWLGVGQLYRCEGTMNQDQYLDVLRNCMLPSARTLFGPRRTFIFQQDNAPCHKARRVCNFLDSKRVRILDWPAQSPDLNPIEHLWEILFRKLQLAKPTSLDDLWKHLTDAWASITPEVLHTLVESMPRRVMQVLIAKGGHTKY